jgi:NAD-dependent SIR2 family protein deacetylase
MSNKIIHCATCGQLVAVLEVGSKIKTGAVVICPMCWGEDKPDKTDYVSYGEDVPDFLKDLFKVRG